MAEKNPSIPITADFGLLPADVASLLDMGADRLVSEAILLDDGGCVYMVGKEVRAERLPALNPKLPNFVTQAEIFVEPDSFVDYITRFKTKTAIVRASLASTTFLGILDYHGDARMGDRDAAAPGRSAHTVTLKCPWDPDYQKWRDIFDKPILQEGLMEFFEDVIHTIAEPVAGDLLDAIGNVELDRSSKFKSVRNLRNGTVQFVYAEDENVGEVVMPMPDVIRVFVPVFQGGNPQTLDVKLRYHLEKGMLAFKLVLPGREKLERDAFRSIGERVRNDTSTPVFYGA